MTLTVSDVDQLSIHDLLHRNSEDRCGPDAVSKLMHEEQLSVDHPNFFL